MLSEEKLKEFKVQLLKLEASIAKDIEEAKKSSQPVELDQTTVGRVSRIDAIQQQQMQASAVRRMEQRATMVQSALTRITDNEYGFCLNCEEPMELKRLEARPESQICIQCAKKKD